ncbi:MAG: ComF family protein, partial [Hydrogenophaga sp.]
MTERQPAAMALCLAAVDYAYPWDTLIARFKFRGEPALAKPMATLMLRQVAVQKLLGAAHWVVPIPVTPDRLAERGYNQAWELGKALLQQSKPPTARGLPTALVRLGAAPDQHDLPADLRIKN